MIKDIVLQLKSSTSLLLHLSVHIHDMPMYIPVETYCWNIYYMVGNFHVFCESRAICEIKTTKILLVHVQGERIAFQFLAYLELSI